METRANLITVGLFVLAVIAAGFAGAYWLLKGTKTGPRTAMSVLFQGSVGGLSPGANVSFNGIKIGEVTSLAFVPGDANRVIAYLSVDTRAPLKVDSRASLGFTGLTGYATVQINGGTNSARPLLDGQDGMPQLTAEAGSVQDLVEGAKRIMGRADETLTSVQTLIDQNGPAVSRTVQNAQTFSDALARNAGTVDRFMTSVGQTADVLTKVSGKVETLTEDLDGLVKAVDPRAVTRIIDRAAQMSETLASSSDHLASAIDEARATITDVRKVVAGVDPAQVSGAVDDFARLSHQLALSSDKLDAIVSDSRGAMADARKLMAAVDPARVGQIVDNAARISGDLAQSSGAIAGLVEDAHGAMGGLKDLSGSATLALGDARRVLAALDPTRIAASLDDIARITHDLGSRLGAVDETIEHVRAASAHVEALSEEVARKRPQVAALIDDAASAMKQLEVASHRVDGILANVDGLVGSPDGKGLFAEGRSFLTEATEAARAFKEMSQMFTAKGDELTASLNRFTTQGLREVQGFVADSRRTLGSIDRAVTEFDRNPQRLLFGPNRGSVPEYGPGRR